MNFITKQSKQEVRNKSLRKRVDKYDVLYTYIKELALGKTGVPVAQWVKRWPADLVVPGSSTNSGKDLFCCKQGYIAYTLSLSPTNPPDMTEIPLKRM